MSYRQVGHCAARYGQTATFTLRMLLKASIIWIEQTATRGIGNNSPSSRLISYSLS